jgi:hypothetical protein
MQAELAARMEERKKEVANLMEEIKLRNELKRLESPLFEERELERQDNLKLDALIGQLEEFYSVDNRKINRVYGYGHMVDKILTIIRSIQYLRQDEKQEMLMMTGLDESTVEAVLDALGNPAYFSVRELRLIEEQPANVDELRNLLKIVSIDMDLVSTLKLNKVTTENINYQFTRARLKAQEALENTLKYASNKVEYTE